MSYRHFGRIGDVWKHIPLCEFLAIEQPISYIQTNSAFPEYQLTNKAMVQKVTNIYRDSTMFDKYPGELKCKEFEIQI